MTLTFKMMEQSTTHDNPVKHNTRNESVTEKMGCGINLGSRHLGVV